MIPFVCFYAGSLSFRAGLEVNTQAHEMLEQLIKGMKRSEGITEQLKSSNQLEWVQRMNSVKHRAEILIQKELIFT